MRALVFAEPLGGGVVVFYEEIILPEEVMSEGVCKVTELFGPPTLPASPARFLMTGSPERDSRILLCVTGVSPPY
jgi:hypothetical protein